MMNSIRIQGVVADVRFSHEVKAEKFLKFRLSSRRKSGTCDVVDVVISKDLADAISLRNGETVEIYGNVRSCETVDERENLQNIFVFCETITPSELIVVAALARFPEVCIFPAQILTFPLSVTLPFKSDLSSIALLDVIPATISSLSIITTSSEDSSLINPLFAMRYSDIKLSENAICCQ